MNATLVYLSTRAALFAGAPALSDMPSPSRIAITRTEITALFRADLYGLRPH